MVHSQILVDFETPCISVNSLHLQCVFRFCPSSLGHPVQTLLECLKLVKTLKVHQFLLHNIYKVFIGLKPCFVHHLWDTLYTLQCLPLVNLTAFTVWISFCYTQYLQDVPNVNGDVEHPVFVLHNKYRVVFGMLGTPCTVSPFSVNLTDLSKKKFFFFGMSLTTEEAIKRLFPCITNELKKLFLCDILENSRFVSSYRVSQGCYAVTIDY